MYLLKQDIMYFLHWSDLGVLMLNTFILKIKFY